LVPPALRRFLGRLAPSGPRASSLDENPLEGLDPTDRAIIERAIPFTMTSVPRLQACVDAVRYVVAREVSGSFAECGVWRGGSVLAMIVTLQELKVSDRDLYLYDTFEGMTAPTERDVSPDGAAALDDWVAAEQRGDRVWPEVFGAEVFDEDRVRETLVSTGYPAERIHLVRGPVEETIPERAPDRLALLRLDTDWYESTHHELVHLYPRLADSGVLMIDDYGHWEGCARAVDEYFAAHGPAPLLSRIDYTGRMAVKH
jgi:hypothetical protein